MRARWSGSASPCASARSIRAQYWSRLKTYDFDMIQWTWGASLSPGNEQINRWSSRAADIEGSLNYAGVKNPAVDAMIEALLQAEAAEDFTAAVRAFDRVLMSGDYVIPLFYLPKVWVAYWSHLRLPSASRWPGSTSTPGGPNGQTHRRPVSWQATRGQDRPRICESSKDEPCAPGRRHT